MSARRHARVVDAGLKGVESLQRGAPEFGEGVLAAELEEVDLVAQRLHLGEVLAPATVDRDQRDALLDGVQ